MNQFAKITLESAIKEYQLGFITATGLVRYWVKTTMRTGWKVRKSPKEIYESLTLSKSAFYKAIATLKQLGYIDFEIHGQISIKNTEIEDPILNSELPSANVDRVHKRGQESPNVDNESTNVDKKSPNVDSQSMIVDRKTPEPSQGMESGNLPDSYQINIRSSSSIYQGNPDDEDEDGNFSGGRPEKATGKKAGRHKLAIKALRPLLKECSEDPREWEKFFDWCDEELWPSFEEPVKNKIGWLKSKDPETELSRLEVNWINYTSQSEENAPRKRSAAQEWQKVLGLAAKLQFGQKTRQLISPNDEAELYKAVMAIGGLGKISGAEFGELSKLKAGFIEAYKSCQDC